MPTNTALTSATLKLIRIALAVGVLLFGLVVWYILRTAAPEPLTDDAANALRLVFFALAVVELPVLFALRSAQARASRFESAARYAILGWALGEGVALFGGVAYLLTARVTLFIIGLLVIATSFAMLPIPDEAPRS